jgi:hypothetical protein
MMTFICACAILTRNVSNVSFDRLETITAIIVCREENVFKEITKILMILFAFVRRVTKAVVVNLTWNRSVSLSIHFWSVFHLG